MRLRLIVPMAGWLLSAGMQGAPTNQQKQCRNTCDAQYRFCLRSATTKAATKACKTAHKPCKKGCNVTRPLVMPKHS